MIENLELRPGEKKFLETLEKIHKEKPSLYERKPEERIRHTVEEIKKQIVELPEIKREEEFHHDVPQDQFNNIIAQSIQIALNESVEKALEFVYQTKNPYIIDAFHDILIGHFLNLLFKNK